MSLRSKSFRSSRRRRGSTAPLVVGILAVAGVAAIAGYFMISSGGSDEDGVVVTKEVKNGPFEHIVIEHGEIESSENIELRCEVRAGRSGSIQILEVRGERSLDLVGPGQRGRRPACDQELREALEPGRVSAGERLCALLPQKGGPLVGKDGEGGEKLVLSHFWGRLSRKRPTGQEEGHREPILQGNRQLPCQQDPGKHRTSAFQTMV